MSTAINFGKPSIGIIGGSGFYELFDGGVEVAPSTPFGDPSDTITIGVVADQPIAFLPRHGRTHQIPAHRINYRANLWALRALGVRHVLAPCAVGSLDRDLAGPGRIVVPDQVIDRTSNRSDTFFDIGAVHVSFADPYCSADRSAVINAGATIGIDVVDGGTTVVVNGPRFSSRAESRWYAEAGCSLVNMTGQPEAALARELALCYTSIAVVTDLDAGIAVGETVTQAEVLRAFGSNIQRLRDLVLATVPGMPTLRDCSCPRSLDGLSPGFDLPGADDAGAVRHG